MRQLTMMAISAIILLATACTQYVYVPVYVPDSEADDSIGIPDYGWVAEGNGTEENPYVLRTVEDILGFAELVTSGNTFNGKTVELVSGQVYDFSSVEDFDGIGYAIRMGANATEFVTPYKPFSGTFDGKGATIRNLSMTMDDPDANINTATGFFNTICRATVKDINFEDCSVSSITNHTGTAIGFALNSNVSGITVRNSSVKAAQGAGGIIGCIFYRPITGDGGPITGQSFSTTDNHAYNVNCYASAANAGAIAGQLATGYNVTGYPTPLIFTGNTASLDSDFTLSATSAAGGLIGYASFGHGDNQFRSNSITIESESQIIARDNPTATGVRGYLIGTWPKENMNNADRWNQNTATVGDTTNTILADINASEEAPAPGADETYNDFAYTAE